MKRIFLAMTIGVCASVLALAQDGGQQPPDNQPQQQRGMRGRGGPGGPGFGGPGGPGRMFNRIAEDLQLDEQQRAQYEEIMGPMREQMKTMGERWRQVRDLEDSGEADKAAEMRRALMTEMQGNQGQMMQSAMDQLETILRPEQVEKFDDMRDRFERDRDSRENFRKIQELPDKLGLTPEQKEKWDAMAQTGREEFGQKWQAMGPMFEAMRAAREAGDTEKAAELQKQIDAQRPDMNAAMSDFLGKVGEILTPEQQATLSAFRDENNLMPQPAAGEAHVGLVDPRDLIKFAKRLRLNDSQKEQFRQIEEDTMAAYRDARRDAAAKAELSAHVKAQIDGILEGSQKQRFDSLIERAQRRSSK